MISKGVIFINKLNDIEELRSRMIQILKKEDYNFLDNAIQEISRKLDKLIIKEMSKNRKS
ncbi:aspartyl-phosphate phosphatase Spo0E family protein [Orenia metallireducens]|uniref:aspartyl-phosphate phosphatase Spo0E family protein n=1 Tax=Orenia metallireducens TaxID=1413210 RepID=UPI000BE25648|nr:aspartyl-phosphate phosphatase Spo0E family protein [Orenia metallireducens]